jgi:hypothetical protein
VKVVEHDGKFKASRIAGPKHNYLGLAFSYEPGETHVVEKSLANDTGGGGHVRAADVLQIVQEVVAKETAKSNRRLYVSSIEFIVTDTPDAQAYAELACAITRYALDKLDCISC